MATNANTILPTPAWKAILKMWQRRAQGRGRAGPQFSHCSHTSIVLRPPGPLGNQMRLFFPGSGSSGVSCSSRTDDSSDCGISATGKRKELLICAAKASTMTMCAPNQPAAERKRAGFPWLSIRRKPATEQSVSRRTFPSAANTFLTPELVRRLAPLQADPPEPQVEEERGGLCQMEINTENSWPVRAGGEGFRLLLKVHIGHRCPGNSVGPALCHTWVAIC